MRKVGKQEFNEFVVYCWQFYGIDGIYDMGASAAAVRAACRIVTYRKDIPFNGDTLDRETVATILLDLGYSEQGTDEAAA